MSDERMALLTIDCSKILPELGVISALLGLNIDDLDSEFGLIAIDPERKMYAFRAKAELLSDLPAEVSGPFSDTGIDGYFQSSSAGVGE